MIDPGADFAEQLAVLRRRIDELERRAGRRPGAWQTLTLASANWTQTEPAEWRMNGDRVELRGFVARTTSTFTAGGTLFGFGSGNPPNPGRNIRLFDGALVAAASPDATILQWFTDTGGGVFRTTTATHALAVGDSASLNQIWWPA